MKGRCIVQGLRSDAIHMYSGITSGRVLDGELLYTKILEMSRRLKRNPHETVCRSDIYIDLEFQRGLISIP